MEPAAEPDRSSASTHSQIEGSINNILVPTDFSPPAEQALRKAVVLARQCGATITLLYVVDVNFHTPPTGPANAGELEKRLEQEGREQLGKAVRKLTAERVKLCAVIQEGLPHEKICEAARQFDLVVMGQERPKPFWRVFSRRTVAAVLEKAPCPVVVVPAQNGERSLSNSQKSWE